MLKIAYWLHFVIFNIFEKVTCSPDEFKCGSTSVCIPKTKECDSTRDCPNGEDEHGNCSKLPTVLLEMSGQILEVTICCVGRDWI